MADIDDVWSWAPPGPGVWYLTREHFPAPVSRLFATLFPPVTIGWWTSARRYGLPDGEPRWASVEGWMYYAPSAAAPAEHPALEAAAERTLTDAPWRDDVARWHDEQRPRIVAANRALQAEDLTALDVDALVEHLARAVAHFAAVGPIHFELHTSFSVAGGLLCEALETWGLALTDVVGLFAGHSPASAAARDHLDRLVDALRAHGVRSADELPTSLDELRAAGEDVAGALDSYLDEYGWRALDQHELRGRVLAERPDLVRTSLAARLDGIGGRSPTSDLATVLARLPDADRAAFEMLLDDARHTYQLNDDNVGVTFGWPLGLVRRAILEAGRRLVANGRVHDVDHLFEADPSELAAVLRGDGPSADELARRDARRRQAAKADPPMVIGEPQPEADAPLPPAMARLEAARSALWRAGPDPTTSTLSGVGIGNDVYRGRACVIDDGFDELEPGDVIVATTTHAGHNSVFPIGGAVATQAGGMLSHPAVLARELGLPAVVGVQGLLDHVRTGDIVEVDAVAGVIRKVE
jgi:pyruvate,water dikinase